MKAFVTGASGFIGSAVVKALRREGWTVGGVDMVAPPGDALIRSGDTTDPTGWADALAGVDVIIHTAAVVSNAVDLDEQWRVNVLGTRRVVAAAAAAGVRRIVHLSSIRAFGDLGFPDGVTEDFPVRTDGNPYVDTKIASEHVVLTAHAAGEIEGVIVRPGDVYGPGSRPWVTEPLRLMASGKFMLPASGHGMFSPVHVDDLVAGIQLAASVPEAAGQVFTLTGPRAVTTAEYFGALAAAGGRRAPLKVPTGVAVPLAAISDRAMRLIGRRDEVNPATVLYLTRTGTYSNDKARRMLGYAPSIDLEAGMRSVAEALGKRA